MSTGEVCQEKKGFNPGFVAFVPFGTLLISLFHRTMPLKWVSLASLLKSVSLLSIYANVTRNDILWSIFGVWTFITVCTTVYLNTAKTPNPVGIKRNHEIQDASLIDVAPTILAILGLKADTTMDGRVLNQVFKDIPN